MMNGNCDDAIIAALAEALREKSLAHVMPR
jgi:hypothetical protein